MRKPLAYFLALFLLATACGSRNRQAGPSDGETNTEVPMKPIELTKAEFLTKVVDYENSPTEWNYLGDKPAILDFYASWCGPCKMIAPILEELAKEYAGELYIYKIDTEAEPELAAAFGIRSIPTLLFVPLNDNPQMAQGALPKAKFEEIIQTVLLPKE